MLKILFTVAGLAASALLLAGCSGSPAEEPSSTPQVTTTQAGTTNDPTLGNSDDPLCAAALASIDSANELEQRAGEITELLADSDFIMSNDPAPLNSWGEDVVRLSDPSLDFYAVGIAETAGEDVNADFVILTDFVNDYTLVLARAAADAESPTTFVLGVQDLFSDTQLQEVASAAPTAAHNIATYLGERCGITE